MVGLGFALSLWGCGAGGGADATLVGEWPLSDGTATDTSGNGNNGVLSGATPPAPSGEALTFDGSTSYIDINDPAVLNITGSLTQVAWVNLDAGFGTGYRAIVGKWNDSAPRSYLMAFGSADNSHGNAVFFLEGGGGTVALDGGTAQAAFVGVWSHVAMVYDADANTTKIYVNAVSDGTGTFNDTIQTSTHDFFIGNHTSNTAFWDGEIGKVSIYNRALSASEIAALHAQGPPFSPEALAIFASFTAPPSAARKILINNFVLSLIAGGVWSLLDVLYVFAAVDSQAALINWKNPGTLNASAVGTPTFTTDRGFASIGSGSYVGTGYIPSTAAMGLTQNNAHYAARNLTVANTGSQRIIGNIATTTHRSLIIPRAAGEIAQGIVNDGTVTSFSNNTKEGFFLVNRSAAGARQLYKNGASLGSDAQASTGLPTTEVTFSRDVAVYATGLVIAGGSIGQSLTSGQVTAYYNAELAYMQAVGAV